MEKNYEYDNIISLAKKHNLKKIMIMRNSWNQGNWCIVNKIAVKPDGKYGYAWGHMARPARTATISAVSLTVVITP